MAAWEDAPIIDDSAAKPKKAASTWESAPVVEDIKPPTPTTATPQRRATDNVMNQSPGAQMADTALSIGSGTLAAPLSGLAGIAGSVLPGPAGQGADWVNKTQEALTYEPRTDVGKMATAAVAYPGQKIAQGADYVGGKVADVTGSPAAGAAANTAIQALPLAVSKAASKVAPGGETLNALVKRKAAEIENLQKDATLAKVREAGYVVSPTQAGAGQIVQAVEGLSGKIKTAQQLSQKNQPLTNQLARDEFGLPADAPLDRATMHSVRKTAGQDYDAVRNTGQVMADRQFSTDMSDIAKPYINIVNNFPNKKPNPILGEIASTLETTFDAGAAIDLIRSFRDKAEVAFNAKDGSLGRSYRKMADALESQVDRHLDFVGAPPEIISKFRDARTTIAKTYNLEKAIRESTGNVDAKMLATQLKNGAPLTGNLRTIAEFGQAYPKAAQVPEKIGGTSNLSPFDWAFGIGKGVTAMAGAGASYTTGHPGFAIAGLAPLARPLARNVLVSDAFQNAMVKPGTYGPSLGSRILGAQENVLAPIIETSQGQR
jgi:hypothetical protein